jgi:hypothetical protein
MRQLILFAALCGLCTAAPPGVVIDHQPAPTGQYIGSPSITILKNGNYVASHDLFGPKSTQGVSAVSRVFVSTDKGRTWSKTAEFSDQFWSNLFVHRGKLYLMGCTNEYGRPVIRRSLDNGRTWSEPSYLRQETGYHTAPMPIVVHKGRLWRTYEWHPTGKWGFFQALAVSAPQKADLMDPKSWTFTPRLTFPATGAEPGKHWLEGNIVLTPGKELWNMLRVDNVEKAAILKVTPEGLTFNRLIDFPGGAKKFTIRYDKKTKRYWAMSNPAMPEFPQSATAPASVRNTLALLSSADLLSWKVERIVLQHPDPINHAFQYVDWQFDGRDIIVASRTAFDDEHGGARRAHDANFLTFHRIENFRVNPSSGAGK